MMYEPNFGLMEDLIKKYKPRFRWVCSPLFIEGGYWQPVNYAAETIHLMRIYGHTNIGRRFKE